MTGTVPERDGFIAVCDPLTDFTAEPPWKANNKSVRFGVFFVVIVIIFVWLIVFRSLHSILLPVRTFSCSLWGIHAGLRLNLQWLSRTRGGAPSEQGLPARTGNRGATPTLSTPYVGAPPPFRKGGQPPRELFLILVTLVKKKYPPMFYNFSVVKQTGNQVSKGLNKFLSQIPVI